MQFFDIGVKTKLNEIAKDGRIVITVLYEMKGMKIIGSRLRIKINKYNNLRSL